MSRARRLPLAFAALLLAALPLAGCGDEMDDQDKLMNYRAAEAFPRRSSAQLPPAGTVPREALLEVEPPAVDLALLARGRERYGIFCAPCHGAQGRGNGEVVRRGFPAPPSYHTPRLMAAPARHFYEVISDGYGVMYSYADRVEPRDRWAIAAYIRALQLALAPVFEPAAQPGRSRAVPAADAAEGTDGD